MNDLSRMYQYLPLNYERREIRILKVQRRLYDVGYDDPVICTISHISLREVPRPEYETVSYVWGTATKTPTSLVLNGLEIDVPAGTDQALRCVRLHTGARERNLWIDAICINQRDVKEREQQVSIMGDVYRLSTGNLIYLGEDDGTIARAGLDFKNLLQEVRQSTDGLRSFLNTLFDKDNHDWYETNSALSTRIDSEAMINFYSRPWFGRLWVIQEIILAPRSTFICGHSTLEASNVLRVSVWLNYKASVLPYGLRECQGRHNAADIAYIAAVTGSFDRSTTRRIDFRYLQAISTRFSASEPRDHIYGIFNLLQSSVPGSIDSFDLIAPNYSKSVAQVYRDATVFSLVQSQTLSVWRNIYHRGDNMLDLQGNSSWAPQWHRTFDFRSDVYRLREVFDAALGSEISCPVLTGPLPLITEQLPVRGIRVARVIETTKDMKLDVLENSESLRQIFRSIDDIIIHQEQKKSSRASDSVLAKVLTAGVTSSGLDELRDYLEQNRATPPIDPGDSTPDLQSSASRTRAQQYYRDFHHWANNRRFFGASDGRTGIASSPVREGDLVAVLYGAPWPVILRPSGGVCQFVCQCYVDGIMYGEAILEHRAEEMVDELFVLV